MDGTVQRIAFAGGHLEVRLTPWDARALGFVTAEILRLDLADPAAAAEGLATAAEWAARGEVRYLFGRFPADRARRRALEEAGFAQVETSYRLSARLPLPPLWRRAAAVELVPMSGQHLAQARAMAQQDFDHGRFLEDPLVDEAAARRRTANWIEDLAEQGLAWAAVRGSQLVGFHAERISSSGDDAELILTGASREYSMLAPSLWQAALTRLHEAGVGRCTTTVSAANVGVLNLYCALGFRIDAATLGYRRFL